MKKFLLVLLSLFTFFLVENNTYADTTVCRYSLSNIIAKPVVFNPDGSIVLGEAETIGSESDYILKMSVDDMNSTTRGLNTLVRFEIEGYKTKYHLDNNKVSSFDIFKSNSYSTIKSCPELKVLLLDGGDNDKDYFDISNIGLSTSSSDIKTFIDGYKFESTKCTASRNIYCYYGSNPVLFTHIDGFEGSFKEFSVGSSTIYSVDKSAKYKASISDYTCDGGYTYSCGSLGYFNKSNSGIYPVSKSYWESNNINQVGVTASYHVGGTLYVGTIRLYDKDTNSGAAGFINVPGFNELCDKHPDMSECRKAFSRDTSDEPFDFCEEKGVLKSLKIVHIVITIAKILVPILLIIYGSIDYGKAALGDNQDALEKTTQAFIKKAIVALCIFLIPTIVDAFISMSQSSKDVSDKSGTFYKCASCFAGTKACDTYIETASK